MSKAEDLSGQRFARLIVRLRSPGNTRGHARWECVCDCGNVTIVPAGRLKSGNTRSCGCLARDSAGGITQAKHGLSDTAEYSIWSNIKQRCYNEKDQGYPYYGGKGITMSEEWEVSFETFYRDMGPRPTDQHSIDRKDNSKGYSKENCRWATKEEQANNRCSNNLYEYEGELKTIAQWCRILNLDYESVRGKIRRGSSFEEAIRK